MRYTKVPSTPAQQIILLKKRGLEIPDEVMAEKAIAQIGYFRLTGYMFHLQDRNRRFTHGVCFADVLDCYAFDKRLRMLLLDYLERIEVALRAAITDQLSLSHGFFWYLDPAHFEDLATFHLVNEEIKERFYNPNERFLKAFKAKYVGENMPPSNMAMELLTLGKLTRLYRGLKNKEEKMAIADLFGLPSPILSSWLIYLNNVRNICAHHSRLWNRKVTADRPTIPTRQKYRFHGNLPADFNTTLYGIVSMLDRLLMQFQPDNSFLSDFLWLLDSFPSIPTGHMGFPADWRKCPAWGLKILENGIRKEGQAA